MSARMLTGIAVLGIFLLISAAGCEPAVEKPALRPKPVARPAAKPAGKEVLALKFTEGDMDRYKSTSETSKDYSYEQPSKQESKKEHSGVLSEVIFTQRVKHVGQDGSAIAEIQIDGLKYYSVVSKDVKFDFDSSREGSGSEPLARLIGQTYTIRMLPDGTAKLVDAAKALTRVRAGLAAKVAERLLSEQLVVPRHSVPALLGRSQSPLKNGQRWSVIEKGPESMLQVREYNKAYKVTDIMQERGQRVAVVQMNAKAIEIVDEEGKSTNFFKEVFKGAENYGGQGRLIFNVDTGKVNKSSEKLEASWMATDPDYKEEGGSGPDVLLMSFTQSHSLERLN
jgi:hypothetical protein